MNSFNTHDDTSKVHNLLSIFGPTEIDILASLLVLTHFQIIEKYSKSNVEIHTFNQVCDIVVQSTASDF